MSCVRQVNATRADARDPRRRARAQGVLVLALLAAGCTRTINVTRPEPSSFKVQIVCAGQSAADCPAVAPGVTTCPAPSPEQKLDLGIPSQPVDPLQRYYQAQVTAIDTDGNPYPSYQGTAKVYEMFDGNTTPARSALTPCSSDGLSATSCLTLPFHNGQACLQVSLPLAPNGTVYGYNQTALWVEDSGTHTSYAAGASQPIYRPAPLISDVQFTQDLDTGASALDNKHVRIDRGTGGRPLVVTSISTGAYTVTDMGTPGDHPWGSLEVYSYSYPQTVEVDNGAAATQQAGGVTGQSFSTMNLKVGEEVYRLDGIVDEYLGLTELNFPSWQLVEDSSGQPVMATSLPQAHPLPDTALVNPLKELEPYESGLVETSQWVICALYNKQGQPVNKYDAKSWEQYQQWKVAPAAGIATTDGSCADTGISVQTNITAPSFDPIHNVGKVLCQMKGILSQVIPAPGVNLWMITPRSPDDLGVWKDSASQCPTPSP